MLTLFCMAGCGSGLVSVGGTVRLDGKPISGAGVVFHSLESKGVASSSTNAQGFYQLDTGSRKGAAPGKYRVTIIKDEVVGPVGFAAGPGGVKTKHAIPAKYCDIATSPLCVTVTSSTHDCDFDLE